MKQRSIPDSPLIVNQAPRTPERLINSIYTIVTQFSPIILANSENSTLFLSHQKISGQIKLANLKLSGPELVKVNPCQPLPEVVKNQLNPGNLNDFYYLNTSGDRCIESDILKKEIIRLEFTIPLSF